MKTKERSIRLGWDESMFTKKELNAMHKIMSYDTLRSMFERRFEEIEERQLKMVALSVEKLNKNKESG